MINFVASDNKPLTVTCKDRDTKAAIDLTGMTVKLRYSISGAATVEKTMTVLPPATAGQAEYRFLEGELTAGEMKGEIQFLDGSGDEITSPCVFYLKIRAKL